MRLRRMTRAEVGGSSRWRLAALSPLLLIAAALSLMLPLGASTRPAAGQAAGTVSVASVPSTIAPGQMVTWNVTAIATMDQIADSYITFGIPGGFTFLNASALGGCSFSSPTVTCQMGTLDPVAGDRAVASISAKLADDFHITVGAENVVVTAFLFNGDDDEIATGDAATIISPRADLTVFKIGEQTALAGENFEYKIVIDNTGPSVARSVSFTDDILSTETINFVGTTAPGYACVVTGSGNDRKINCARLSNMAVDARDEATITVRSDETAAISNTVVVDSPDDPNTFNNKATGFTSVRDAADLSVTKTVVGGVTEVTAGNAIEYNIIVTNTGPSTADNVVLTDSLPAGILDAVSFPIVPAGASCTPGTPGVSPAVCNLGSLADGASRTVRIHFDVSPGYVIDPILGAVLQNEVTVRSDAFDPDNRDNRRAAVVDVVASADVAVTKTGPASLVAGTVGTYTMEVTNAGPSFARMVTLTDTLPAGMRAVSAQVIDGALSRCQIVTIVAPKDTVICRLGDLAPGAPGTRTVLVDVQVDPSTPEGTLLTNTVEVGSPITPDPIAANNTDTFDTLVLAPQADVYVTKTGPAVLIAGTLGTYTIDVKNAGPSTAREVRFLDTVANGMRILRFQVNNIDPSKCQILTMVQPGDGIRCDLGDMRPDVSGNRTILLDIQVASSVPMLSVLTDTAQAFSDAGPGSTPDSDLSNNTATFDTTVVAVADLSITKTSDADVYKPSSTVKYTITVVNNGPSNVKNVVVTDKLPERKQAVYKFDTAGCTKNLFSLTCKLGDMPAGTSKSFNVYVRIKGSQGQVVNTASVKGSGAFDLSMPNNSSTRVVLIEGGL